MTNKWFNTNDPFILNANGVNTSLSSKSVNISSSINSSDFIKPNQLDQLTAQFENSITADADSNPLSLAITNNGANTFYSSLGTFTTFISASNIAGSITPTNYPNVYNRISQGVTITPIEFASFMQENLYTANSVQTSISTEPSKVLNLLDDYYSTGFTPSTMDSFCSLFPSIFGSIQFFFNDLAKIGLNIQNLISGIQNFNLSSILSQLQSKILDVVNKVIDKVKKIVENFSINNFMGNIETFVNVDIAKRAHDLKEKALNFFTTFNLDNFTKKIQGLISYSVSLFKNVTLQDIEYLVYRFCTFASEIENIINTVTHPLTNFSSYYIDAHKQLYNSSLLNRSKAVSAGALRYNDNVRKIGVDSSITKATLAGNIKPITPSELDNITKWNDGKGDSNITFSGNWITALGKEGWSKVDPEVKVLLLRVQKDFGKQLIVNSGYRSPEYNKTISGSATNSYHMQGMAVDITWSGITEEQQNTFINIAKANGFRGIGKYISKKFVHIDIGPERSWIQN